MDYVSFAKLRFGDFELDTAAFELRRQGRRMRLERIPMDLLHLLVERRGSVVTRDEIVERLWGKHVFVDTGEQYQCRHPKDPAGAQGYP